MRCSACSTENPPQAKFCLECGAPLARRCSACGIVLPDVAKFCLECGQPIPAAGVPPTPSIAPQTYTPRHLAKKILASRADLEGERKQVTILFADVVGSTELIQGRDAEDAQALLDGVVKLMMEAVHRYEGTVSRLMGDGLMAMFGAPSPTRTTPFAPATPPWRCWRPRAATPPSFVAGSVSPWRSASA